ncbi:hypothetical protein BDZ97DRAFT_1813357 [Flammula alnicola]|nr:hypothetical protein BDZ97DRAFT_1813357 [Flammula alnicola]
MPSDTPMIAGFLFIFMHFTTCECECHDCTHIVHDIVQSWTPCSEGIPIHAKLQGSLKSSSAPDFSTARNAVWGHSK